MTDQSSRHAGLATYRRRVGGTDRDIELYQPRLRTPPPAILYHRVTASDRLDLIAYRYLGDPHQFWRLADANPDSELEQLMESGRKLGIPKEL
jgi:hypothetical protein